MSATRTGTCYRFQDLAAASLAASPPATLPALRRRAAERFAILGLPSTRLEAWRFSDLSALARAEFALPAALSDSGASDAIRELRFPGDDHSLLVFLDGRSVASLSRTIPWPRGVVASALAGAGESTIAQLGRIADFEGHSLVALNTAGWSDGLLLSVADGVTVEDPIHLLWLTRAGETTSLAQPRVLLQFGRNAQATVVESYGSLGEGRAMTNAVSEVWLGENAVLDHYRIQREGPGTYHFGTVAVRQSRSSTLRSFVFSAGARVNRTEIQTVFDGEGATCALNGLYLGRGHQLVDHQTSIDHATPHGTSTELYKGILDERSRAVFNGKIVVRPDAQKSNARQTNKNLILSDETMVNSKPQLEIFANDVLCAHGATVGQLDSDSLFYLRSRGIPADRAARLLTYAFASELIQEVRIPGLRGLLFQSLFSDLSHVEELWERS